MHDVVTASCGSESACIARARACICASAAFIAETLPAILSASVDTSASERSDAPSTRGSAGTEAASAHTARPRTAPGREKPMGRHTGWRR